MLVFQYGSNCDTRELNGPDRLAGRAVDLGRAVTVESFVLAFDKFSKRRNCAAADLIPSGDGLPAWGVLYEITADDFRILEQKIEGPGYEITTIDVVNIEGTTVHASTFVVRSNRRTGGLFTNAQYVGHIVRGLRDHDVPEQYVEYVLTCAIATNGRAENCPRNENVRIAQFYKATEEAFNDLLHFVMQFDPVRLLAQLSLTHLRVPADRYIGEDDEVTRWAVWIEFLTGVLLTRGDREAEEPAVTGETMRRVEDLIQTYYSALQRPAFIPSPEPPVPLDLALGSVRNYALHVRGDAHPHQYYPMARTVYAAHGAWFRANLGFTIEDAINVVEAWVAEYSRRMNSGRTESLQQAEKIVAERELTGAERENTKLAFACYLFFGHAHEVLAVTIDELAALSHLPREVCVRVLDRLSQEFGYKNPAFPHTFTDPKTAPWDYNTLYERPIVKRRDRYWMLVPSIMQTVLLTTFYFDLMQDASYRPTFDASRGRSLETKAAEYLMRLFPPEEVLLNPQYPDGNELADVLVMHDRKLVIVQCKSKGLTFPARMGASIAQLKSDLEKAVKDAFSQGVRARQYLLGNAQPVLRLQDKRQIIIDRSQVNAVFIVNVTASALQNLTTRWASINPQLGLFAEDDYPWSLSLADLDVLTEILLDPPHFIHYASRRLALEQKSREVLGDEIDLLGFYLTQGLYFDVPEFEHINGVSIAGMSGAIDEYLYEKYILGRTPPHPKSPAPPGFDALVTAIAALRSAYRVDVAMTLIDFGYTGRKSFMEQVTATNTRTMTDGKLHDFSLTLTSGERGISYLAMDAHGDEELLMQQLGSLALLKKHQLKCGSWAGIGWDLSTDRPVDVAFYAEFEPEANAVLDEIISRHLKPGRGIKFQ